ncbi:RNA polymerase sigma factor [Sunxiuqinia sp. A32]|uniref:RNA polymerase sigma factor n=1 Tax=Sunxiuqinia sp. A32 TaxID=3461496 RepID=UPI004045275D
MTKQEFKIVFDQHFDDIRAYVYYRSGDRDLATDVAQDVFMRLWEKQLKWEGKKTLGLLYKIASDEFISKYRRQRLELDYRKGIEFGQDDDSPDEQLQYNEMKGKYEKALAELSEKQRIVFLMSRMDGLKYQEIAQRLGISVKAVEKRMKVALRDLKLNLGVS